ncbi:uncharacterized protein TNCV_2995771 [Trichonephila clavipes]|nr:uncharacterized protein TNCV_2995771 [Trichonephila clavipes]
MLSSRPGAIYQQDNARPHTARLSQQCLQGYDVLPWPARSRSFANRACLDALGRQLQPSRDTGELTAQMQRLWQGSSTGGNKNSAFVRRNTHKEFSPQYLNSSKKYPMKVMIWGCDQGETPEIMDEILTTVRDLELEANEDDIKELLMGHEDELTIEDSKKF